MTGSGGSTLGPGREFDLIRSLLAPSPLPSAGVVEGPGDDCAVLDGGLVVSVDLSVEGIHFRRDWFSLEEAGFRATAGALSDLAAMAAEPLGVLLSMGLPQGETEAVSQALQRGAWEACRSQGVQILGGDLSGSQGPVILDVAVLGRADTPLLRRGCLPGDEVWMTGWVGGSGVAVHLLGEGRSLPETLRERLIHPSPRIREMRWLQDRATLTAGIDLSDGLAGDAGHLAAASEVRVILESEKILLDPGMEGVIRDSAERLHFGLRGGEDYEVCFTAPPGEVEGQSGVFREAFGIPLTRIGRVEAGEGALLQHPDGTVKPLLGGFDHFSDEEQK